MINATPSPKANSLRAAQRAMTRSRIREAGRELFFKHGYERATIDEIAQMAGASRSTLYVHFRDKDEILAEIVEDYTPGLLEVVSTLRGPLPSRPQIDAWLRDLAIFITRERTPTVLIVGMANAEDVPQAIMTLGERLHAALAMELPAFGAAIGDGPEQLLAKAWASVAIREVGRACQHWARHQGNGSAILMRVAGDIFERFLHEYTKDNRA